MAVGGSATVDGGLGALEALDFDLRGADVVVACDVSTTFVDAARSSARRRAPTPRRSRRSSGGSSGSPTATARAAASTSAACPAPGAAGGLAGGLAAYGARLVPGATLVADEVGLRSALATASLVLTGEGRLDATSFAGKVVGHVLGGTRVGVPAAIVAGDAEARGSPEGVAA